MLGLLRLAASAAARRAAPQLPGSVAGAGASSLPFIPTDWVFRFAPGLCRDRVRFMYRFNIISFGIGFGYFYVWSHMPYKCDHYEGFYESPLYRYVRGSLERTGQLEENLRIKARHFYPQTE